MTSPVTQIFLNTAIEFVDLRLFDEIIYTPACTILSTLLIECRFISGISVSCSIDDHLLLKSEYSINV